MATTPNMLLDLPIVSVTLGPEWATELNAALTKVDLHDHSSNKGVKITPSGLNINADLTIASNHLTNIKSSRFTDNLTTLTTPADVRSLYTVNGNLYYNNGAGTPVQITSGVVIPVSSDGISRAYETTDISSNTTISPSNTFSYIEVDTSTSVQITLPSAAAVASGRFYVIKDVTGSADTNNITIVLTGGDTIDGVAASSVIDVNFASFTLVSDGISNWSYMESSLDLPGDLKIGGDVRLGSSGTVNENFANESWENFTRPVSTTVSRRGVARSGSSGFFTRTLSTFADVTNLSVTIDVGDRPVMLCVIGDDSVLTNIEVVDTGTASAFAQVVMGYRYTRNGTSIGEHRLESSVQNTTGNLENLTLRGPLNNCIDFPPSSGTYTYKLQAALAAGTEARLYNIRLVAFEL